MLTIEEKRFKLAMQKIKINGEKKLKKEELRKEKLKYRRKINLPSTSKVYFSLLLIFSIVVAIFSMMAMWHFGDLSALYGLIGATITPAIGYISYNIKSTKENLQKFPEIQPMSYSEWNQSSEITNETDNEIVKG